MKISVQNNGIAESEVVIYVQRFFWVKIEILFLVAEIIKIGFNNFKLLFLSRKMLWSLLISICRFGFLLIVGITKKILWSVNFYFANC